MDADLVAWHEIPGWFQFRHVYDAAVAEAAPGARFVELGVALGRSTLYMAQKIAESGKDIHFTCIDRWQEDGQTLARPLLADYVRAHRGFQAAFEWNRQHSGVAHFIQPVKAEIVAAAASFPDGSLDFVFLDAGHTYEKTRQAINAWLPKLKPGGVLAGDDFADQFPGLVLAVNEALPDRRIEGRAFVWRAPG